MKIETKYEVGQHIYIIYEYQEEVHIYDDYIVNIVIDEEKKLRYCTKISYEELIEEDIILYEEKEKLLSKIEELLKQIRQKESENE